MKKSPKYLRIQWRGQSYEFVRLEVRAVKFLLSLHGHAAHHADVCARIGAKGCRLRDIFRNHPAWDVMIVAGKQKGTVRIPLEDEMETQKPLWKTQNKPTSAKSTFGGIGNRRIELD